MAVGADVGLARGARRQVTRLQRRELHQHARRGGPRRRRRLEAPRGAGRWRTRGRRICFLGPPERRPCAAALRTAVAQLSSDGIRLCCRFAVAVPLYGVCAGRCAAPRAGRRPGAAPVVCRMVLSCSAPSAFVSRSCTARLLRPALCCWLPRRLLAACQARLPSRQAGALPGQLGGLARLDVLPLALLHCEVLGSGVPAAAAQCALWCCRLLSFSSPSER